MANNNHQAQRHEPYAQIAVIADDFTGAAEIGGICVRRGFGATIVTSFNTGYDAEVLIVAANTRDKSAEEAKKIIRELTIALLEIKPVFIYKKIDSVLRGNVGEELIAQMEVSGKQRVLIIPSTPSLNRIIKDGVCYDNGLPLNRSRFSVSEIEIESSANALDLLVAPNTKKTVVSRGEELPQEGLVIGNTLDDADLDYWAGQLDDLTIMAGAASFFNAILKNRSKKSGISPSITLGHPKLYICGSAFKESREIVAVAHKMEQTVAYMPVDLFREDSDQQKLMDDWEVQILSFLHRKEAVILAVDAINGTSSKLPAMISNSFAEIVKRVMEKQKVQELLIEGGHTASSIIEKLGLKKFYPVQELALGVIRMSVDGNNDLFLTLKPGSYKWPISVSP